MMGLYEWSLVVAAFWGLAAAFAVMLGLRL